MQNVIFARISDAERSRKIDFGPYIIRYTYTNDNFEYGYANANAVLQFCLKLKHCKPHVIQ